MTSRHPMVNQLALGHLGTGICFYCRRARIKVQEEIARAQNENRWFSQADLGFFA